VGPGCCLNNCQATRRKHDAPVAGFFHRCATHCPAIPLHNHRPASTTSPCFRPGQERGICKNGFACRPSPRYIHDAAAIFPNSYVAEVEVKKNKTTKGQKTVYRAFPARIFMMTALGKLPTNMGFYKRKKLEHGQAHQGTLWRNIESEVEASVVRVSAPITPGWVPVADFWGTLLALVGNARTISVPSVWRIAAQIPVSSCSRLAFLPNIKSRVAAWGPGDLKSTTAAMRRVPRNSTSSTGQSYQEKKS